MTKLKGIKKLNKAIATELSTFKVQAVLEEEFGMYIDERTVAYALTHSVVDEWFDEFVLKTFGFNVGENDFAMSLLHEIGHLKTMKNIDDDTIEQCHKKIEKITKKLDKVDSDRKEKNLHFKYFDASIFKKGTCHIVFTDLELLDRLNIYGSQRKGWLPPSYGKKQYSNMTDEEKRVVDEFQGEEAYTKVMQNPAQYIIDTPRMMMLTAGATQEVNEE